MTVALSNKLLHAEILVSNARVVACSRPGPEHMGMTSLRYPSSSLCFIKATAAVGEIRGLEAACATVEIFDTVQICRVEDIWNLGV